MVSDEARHADVRAEARHIERVGLALEAGSRVQRDRGGPRLQPHASSTVLGCVLHAGLGERRREALAAVTRVGRHAAQPEVSGAWLDGMRLGQHGRDREDRVAFANGEVPRVRSIVGGPHRVGSVAADSQDGQAQRPDGRRVDTRDGWGQFWIASARPTPEISSVRIVAP